MKINYLFFIIIFLIYKIVISKDTSCEDEWMYFKIGRDFYIITDNAPYYEYPDTNSNILGRIEILGIICSDSIMDKWVRIYNTGWIEKRHLTTPVISNFVKIDKSKEFFNKMIKRYMHNTDSTICYIHITQNGKMKVISFENEIGKKREGDIYNLYCHNINNNIFGYSYFFNNNSIMEVLLYIDNENGIKKWDEDISGENIAYVKLEKISKEEYYSIVKVEPYEAIAIDNIKLYEEPSLSSNTLIEIEKGKILLVNEEKERINTIGKKEIWCKIKVYFKDRFYKGWVPKIYLQN